MPKSHERRFSGPQNRICVGVVSPYLTTVPHNCILAFELELNKVNLDGPSLKFSVGSSVSEVLHRKIPGLDLIEMQENSSEVVDISCWAII
jgi:hypothetical protein